MIINKVIWPLVLVGLPDANLLRSMTISKHDYTIPINDCQQSVFKNTKEYNYWTTEKLIEYNNNKYQDILW